MLELDGSEGGGQLVRTALSLSALAGTPFEMGGIRGDRKTPGLRPQHLAAVEAVAAIANADVGAGDDHGDDDAGHDDDRDVDAGDGDDGARVGDDGDRDGDDGDRDGDTPAVGTGALTFDPGTVAGGEYEVDVGTAGSVTLVLDAVLPLATALAEPLRLTVRGGTDVRWSPALDYHRFVKLPLLRRYGLQAALEVDRRGFYPEGGGAVTLHLAPSTFSRITLTDSTPRGAARVYSVASDDLASNEVADRQAVTAAGLLEDAGLDVVERVTSYVATRSTGSVVLVALGGGIDGQVPAGFSALGERGKPSEDVARDAVESALAARAGPGVVDPHMADQLVPYLALAGGEVAIPRVTDHVETVVALVERFGYEVRVERRGERVVLVG